MIGLEKSGDSGKGGEWGGKVNEGVEVLIRGKGEMRGDRMGKVEEGGIRVREEEKGEESGEDEVKRDRGSGEGG